MTDAPPHRTHVTRPPFRLDTVVWELTRRCTFSCSYCGSRAGRALPREMGVDEQLKVADALRRRVPLDELGHARGHQQQRQLHLRGVRHGNLAKLLSVVNLAFRRRGSAAVPSPWISVEIVWIDHLGIQPYRLRMEAKRQTKLSKCCEAL